MLGRLEEEVRGSAWFHLHIRCVRARFLCGSGMVVALLVLELVELVWQQIFQEQDFHIHLNALK